MFQKTFTPAILAGICISIGCVVNLRVGGVAGAVLFAFGLTTVVYYGLKLYTGTAGFIRRQGDWSMLLTVLFAVDGAFRQYYRLSAHGVAHCLCPARLCGACCQDPRRSSGERALGMFPPGYRLRFHHDDGCRVRP